MDELTRRNQAVEQRDAAARRVRRLTLGTAAAAAAGAGVIAGVAASSSTVSHTSAARPVSSSPPRRREPTTVAAVPEPTATVPAATEDAAASSPGRAGRTPGGTHVGRERRSPSSSRADRDMPRRARGSARHLLAEGTRYYRARCRHRARGLLAARGTLLRALRAVDLGLQPIPARLRAERLNTADGATRRVGPVLWEALVAAVETARATDGLVDPTVGKAMRLAGYDRTFSRVALRDGALVAATFVPSWALGGDRARSRAADRASTRRRRARSRSVGQGAHGRSHRARHLGVDRLRRARLARRRHRRRGRCSCRRLGRRPSPTITRSPPDTVTDPGHDRIRWALASSGIRVRRWRTAAASTITSSTRARAGRREARGRPSPWQPPRASMRTRQARRRSCSGTPRPRWLEARRLPARLVRLDGRALCVGGFPDDLVAA